MSGILERVVHGSQVDAERQLDQPIGEPDVLRQKRSVEVGADQVAAAHALVAVAPVVPVPLEDAAERPLSLAEVRTAAVILEAGDHPGSRPQVGLDCTVTDQPGSLLAHRP